DTLFIFDVLSRKLSRYLNDGRLLGSFAFPGRTAFAPRTKGGYALIANPREKAAPRLEVRSPADSTIDSFTVSNDVFASVDQPWKAGAKLNDIDGQSMWLTFSGEYLLERYDYNGTKLNTIKQELSWFPPRRVFQKDMTRYDTLAGISDFT